MTTTMTTTEAINRLRSTITCQATMTTRDVGVVDTTEESIDSIQSNAGDDDEADVDREVDKGGDVITNENRENDDTAEGDVTVTSHAPLSTVTD